MKKFLLTSLVLGLSGTAMAKEETVEVSSVHPRVGSAGFSSLVFGGQNSNTASGDVVINMTHNCFGTNLRHVSNPVSPTANLTMNLIATHNGATKVFSFKYPASVLLSSSPTVQIIDKAGVGGLEAQAASNTVRVVIPTDLNVTTKPNGDISIGSNFKIQGVTFNQTLTNSACGANAWLCLLKSQYMGKNGPLSAKTAIHPSKDNKTYDIKVDIPGENGFCAGFYSPLMVFFDDQRPQFTAAVDFPLSPMSKTYWPEKGSPGALIAYDRNGDGKITTADELFGNSDKTENGFEALREFDSNKDGLINRKDKKFSKLLLWFDNGDGVSGQKELVPLGQKIKSVSLVYDGSTTYAVGDRAEARQKGTFTFVKKGKVQTGTVIDYWFAPVKEVNLANLMEQHPGDK